MEGNAISIQYDKLLSRKWLESQVTDYFQLKSPANMLTMKKNREKKETGFNDRNIKRFISGNFLCDGKKNENICSEYVYKYSSKRLNWIHVAIQGIMLMSITFFCIRFSIILLPLQFEMRDTKLKEKWLYNLAQRDQIRDWIVSHANPFSEEISGESVTVW